MCECKLVQPLWKTVWSFLKKLKIDLPYDPEISLLGIHPNKTIIQKRYTYPYVHRALFTIAEIRKQHKCPSTDEWIKMIWGGGVNRMEYYSAIKKDEIMLLAATWINLKTVTLSKVTQIKTSII